MKQYAFISQRLRWKKRWKNDNYKLSGSVPNWYVFRYGMFNYHGSLYNTGYELGLWNGGC